MMTLPIRRFVVSILVLVVLSVRPAFAQDASPETSSAPAVHGLLSFGYSLNAGRPESRTNQLRVFDADDRRLKLDVAELSIQKAPSGARHFGFRSDIIAGASVPHVTASYGLFRDRETGEVRPENFDIKQAFLSYAAPIGSGLKIDAGKFATIVGSEVIEGAEGTNDNYSHGFLFGFAEPFTHTGVRASYTVNPAVTVAAILVNGWDNVRDNNSGKTFGAQVAFTATPEIAIVAAYLGGPERPQSGDIRHVFNTVLSIKPSERLTFVGSVDAGQETNGAGPDANARWFGVSGVTKVSLNAKSSVAGRLEWFADRTGARTGTIQDLAGFTVTPAVRVGSAATLRGDFRVDRSTAAVFEGDAHQKRTQITGAINLLFQF